MSLDKVKTIGDLASYVYVMKPELLSLDTEKLYHTFQAKKPGSFEKRIIESPFGKLKEALERLSDGFQWLYYDHKTDAAFGFVRSYEHDVDKRNILTNASSHLRKDYMLKLDFDEFFYQIDCPKLKNIFNDYTLFSFLPETEEFLTKFVTLYGRLPMGSPTSPALSNFSTILLDNELLTWCRHNNIVYTRYVDDLTFSSEKPITNAHIQNISVILNSHRFRIDPSKTKKYGEKDKKEVTGLIVGDQITIPDEYLAEVDTNIQKLASVFTYAHLFPDWHITNWLQKLKQSIGGQIAFIGSVYGKHHPLYIKLSDQFDQAVDNPDIEESISWRYIGYEL
jgi:RNA-directed DNA polymerase